MTVEVEKIRDGTAIALPVDVHDPGLSPGRTVTVQTVAGEREATVERLHSEDESDQSLERDFTVTLSQPAPVTGQAMASLTTASDDGMRAELRRKPDQLPAPNTTVVTSVEKGHSRTVVQLDNTDLEVAAKFNQSCPINGRAVIELGNRQDGIYQATIVRYSRPDIRPGATYRARVYNNKNHARIEREDRKIPVALADDISETGEAPVRITEISDAIHGRVEGEIESLTFDDPDTDISDVDMTNLSKF